MLAAGMAVWRVWLASDGPAPSVMAGHSMGEYTALVCAGAIGFADAIDLVAERGRCMQRAVVDRIAETTGEQTDRTTSFNDAGIIRIQLPIG